MDEEDGHVQWGVGMALGLVLRCPNLLPDDRATIPDGKIEQPDGAAVGIGEGAAVGQRWLGSEECRRPPWVVGCSKRATINLQKPTQVTFGDLWPKGLGDVAVDK